MADTKISALAAASALTGDEIFPLVQAAATKRSTARTFADFARVAKSVAGAFDGAQAYDGVVSGTAFSSSGTTFTAADVGKTIAIVGAGTSGANHVTTIATFVSAHAVTLTASAPTAIASGAWFVYGTDDTAAWQSCINALTNGGRIICPAGISVIAGALQTGSNYNAQVKLPVVTGTNPAFTIEIEGAIPAQPVAFWPAYPSTSGTIIFSTRIGSGTRPATFGGSHAPGTTHNFSEIRLNLKNLTMRTLPDAGIAGVDATLVSAFSTHSCYFDTLSSVDRQTSAPANATGIAFYCSGRGSQCCWSIRDTYITGYYTSFVNGEGGWIDNVFVFSCLRAGENPVVDYPTHFGNFIVSWCPRGIVWTGEHHCNIGSYLTEHWASVGHGASWMTQVYDFDDGGTDRWHGRCDSYYEVTAGVGRTNNLLVNGCAKATIVSGSAVQEMVSNLSDTTIADGGTFTDVTNGVVTIDGGGDYEITVEVTASLNALVGPTIALARLYDVTAAAAVPNSLFPVYYADNGSAETRIVHVEKKVLLRSPGPSGRQYKLQVSVDYASGTSFIARGSAWVNGGSYLVSKAA